jgi:hypothetical protein
LQKLPYILALNAIVGVLSIRNNRSVNFDQTKFFYTSEVFREEPRSLPILAEAEVIVLGGGPGGCGAGLAAARNGSRVVLVERFGCLGGTWTSGLLSSIMPFPHVKGIFGEIIARLDAAGGWYENGHWDPYESGPVDTSTASSWGHGGTYDAEILKRVLDEMIIEAGVEPLYFLQTVGVFRDGDRLKGVIVESKEGRFVIPAKIFIDASGDGDISHMAGVPTQYGREEDGQVQPMTLMFKMDGVEDSLAEASREADPRLEKTWQAAKRLGEITVPRENILLSRSPRPGEWVFNTTRILGLDGTRVRDVTLAMIEGRRQVEEISNFMRRHVPGFENARVSETAAHVGVRETRRVYCDYTLTKADILNGANFDDGIARGSWAIDIHNPGGEGTEIQNAGGKGYYEIPYRSIRARGIQNLLIASRCIDCTHEAHAAIRITPQIMAIGQAAGTAASICIQRGFEQIRDIDCKELRSILREQNANI